MKINRSAKCSLKFSNKAKLELLDRILVEYSRVVNQFVDHFWETPTKKSTAGILEDQSKLVNLNRLIPSCSPGLWGRFFFIDKKTVVH